MNDLRINDLFALDPIEDMFRGLARPWGTGIAARAPQIKIDVNEADANYVVKAEVPGVRKEDIQVSLEGSTVTLRAEVKQEDREAHGEKLLRSERYYGAVARSFQLPQEVDPGQAKAKYDNGMLTLTLPKKAATSSQRLAID